MNNIQSVEEKYSEPVGVLIKIEQIQVSKRQPRHYFNAEKISELTESIKEYGILEPLIVRPLEADKYELVAGERRYKAAKEAKLSKIPVIIKEINEEEAFELALLENMQRDDLNAIEETEGMLDLICQTLKISRDKVIQLLNRVANAQKRNLKLQKKDQEEIEIIDQLFLKIGGLNRESFRTNRLPLLNLPKDVLKVLREGRLQYTKGKAISKVENKTERKKLIEKAIKEKLSLSQIKKEIETIKKQIHTQSSQKEQIKYYSENLHKELKKIIEPHLDLLADKNKKDQIETLLDEIIKIVRE